jgi:hypothetical protein
LAIDNFRLAVETNGRSEPASLEVTHLWKENGMAKSSSKQIPAGATAYQYAVEIPKDAKVENQAVIFQAK